MDEIASTIIERASFIQNHKFMFTVYHDILFKSRGTIMIKNYTNNTLRDLGVNEKYFLFCQVWKELTDDRTFDTYQYKSLNILNGLRELIHNIDNYLNGSVTTTHSISSVCEEVLKYVGKDHVLKNHFINIRNLLLNVLGKDHETIAKLKALRYKLELFYSELSLKYDDALIDTLSFSVENETNEVTVDLTSAFISRCIYNGWSAKALSSKLDLTEGKNISDFLRKIHNYACQKYLVLFPFRQIRITPPKGKTREESKEYVCNQLKKFDIHVLTKAEILRDYPEISKDCITNDEYMSVTCSEKDIYSASHSAVLSLSNSLNVLSFFSAVEPWSVNKNSWIVFNTESPYTVTLRPIDIYRTYEYVDSSSIVYARIEQLIHTETHDCELYQKIISAFSYTNLSHASMTVEEKYMNMRIALESLTRTDAYEGIIKNILLCVPNACSLRYTYRIIRNFIEDCVRCEISLSFETISIDINEANKEKIVAKMITILRDPTLSQIMLTRCECSNLLKFRCAEIISVITDEKALIQHIESHHKTVEWHLDRLYRIRNEIAHAALSQQVSTVRYTEHLYDYLATYLSELVRFAAQKEITSFGVLSSAINENYNEFKLIVDEKKIKNKKEYFGNLWINGIMDFI